MSTVCEADNCGCTDCDDQFPVSEKKRALTELSIAVPMNDDAYDEAI